MFSTTRLVVAGCALATAAWVGTAAAQGNDSTGMHHGMGMGGMHHGSRMGGMMMGDTMLTASLTTAAEGSAGGAMTGSGSATLHLEPKKGRICYTLTTTGLTNVTAAHIHHGTAGKNGPPVVPLHAPKNGHAKSCASATASVIRAIMQHPSSYYVNVHDKAHPAGAIRGQLAGGGSGM